MKGFFPLILLVLLTACTSKIETAFSNEKPTPAFSPSPAPTFAMSDKLDCNQPDQYSIVVNDGKKDRTVDVLVNGSVHKAIPIPRQPDAEPMGFSLSWAKKNARGFEISIEYGSRFYFDKTLFFECKKDNFLLTKIVVASFDKNDPEKSSKNKTVIVKPTIALDDFRVEDFWKGEP